LSVALESIIHLLQKYAPLKEVHILLLIRGK